MPNSAKRKQYDLKVDARELMALANCVEIARQKDPNEYDVVLAQNALLRVQDQLEPLGRQSIEPQ